MGGYSRSVGLRQIERFCQIEIHQRPATSFVFAGQQVVEAIAVELHQRLFRQRRIFPGVSFVPPRDDRVHADPGAHQQRQVGRWTVDMQIARPPAFRLHVHEPSAWSRFRLPSPRM